MLIKNLIFIFATAVLAGSISLAPLHTGPETQSSKPAAVTIAHKTPEKRTAHPSSAITTSGIALGSSTIEMLIRTAPKATLLSPEKQEEVYQTLKCESKFYPSAVGDKGTSFGLAQIHLPAHPNITKAQALDPVFAINWTVEQFAAGHESQWTCWRTMYA